MRVLPILVAVVVLGAASGCGSSRAAGINFHSARHHYTVTQVERAFAAQGIRLRRSRYSEFPSTVALSQAIPVGVNPMSVRPGSLVSLLVRVSAGPTYGHFNLPLGYRSQRHGNVRVFASPPNRPVETALARLH